MLETVYVSVLAPLLKSMLAPPLTKHQEKWDTHRQPLHQGGQGIRHHQIGHPWHRRSRRPILTTSRPDTHQSRIVI